MKITAAQLKQIITEEIKRAAGSGARLRQTPQIPAVKTMLDAICDDWKSEFDPMDPSMDAAGGRQVWEAQCDEACEPGGVLDEQIEAIIMQAEEDLHSGKYYRG